MTTIAAAATTTTTKVASTTVERAVTALLKWKESQSQTQNPKLVPDDEFIYLITTLKKIPPKSRTNPSKIPLPHPLHAPPSSELCLIIDDRPNSKPTKQAVKELIKEQNIPIAKVITLSKLKASYKPFESKRKLCDSYDLFLVDKRVVHFLPKLLGKEFFRRRKLPVGVDLGKKEWGGQVEKVCRSGLFYMGTGTCCVVKVGKVAMGKEEIVENVLEGISGVVGFVPKKWDGVRSLHLKLADSVALPLYQALPDVKLKIEGVRKKEEEVEDMIGSVVEAKAESTDEEGLKGKEGKKKKKGRIHEVRYMDVGLAGGELESEDDEEMVKSEESAGEESSGDENVGKKRKKGALTKGFENEGSDEDSEENEDFGCVKRKKVKSVKPKKRGIKAEKTEGVKATKGSLSLKGGDKSGEKKGKRKSELVTKSNDSLTKAKDKRSKKRVAAE